jgi:hypothetical protein
MGTASTSRGFRGSHTFWPRLRALDPDRAERAQVAEQELFATFDLTGLQTHDREPGSDEWDDLVGRISHDLVRAVGTSGRAYHLAPTRFAIRAHVDPRSEQELLLAVLTALTDPSFGIAVIHSTVTHVPATELD